MLLIRQYDSSWSHYDRPSIVETFSTIFGTRVRKVWCQRLYEPRTSLRVYVPSHLSHLHQLCYFQDNVKCISGVLTSVIVEKLTQEQFLQIERSVTGRIIKSFTNFVLALQWPPLCPCAIQSCLHVLSLPDLLESQYSST